MSSKPKEIDEEEEEEKQEPEESQQAPAASQEPELKLVINMKGNRAVIGVQATECDPVILTAEGDLTEILFNLAGYAEQARKKWQATPRYPKSDLPQLAPAPATRQVSPAPAKSSSGKEKIDEKLWKPLF